MGAIKLPSKRLLCVMEQTGNIIEVDVASRTIFEYQTILSRVEEQLNIDHPIIRDLYSLILIIELGPSSSQVK